MTGKNPPPGYVIYHLEYNDGKIELPLSQVHRLYLCFIADRGGETRLDYEPLNEEQQRHIRELIEPLRCLSEHESIGDRKTLVIQRLTDTGRNIVTAIKKAGEP